MDCTIAEALSYRESEHSRPDKPIPARSGLTQIYLHQIFITRLIFISVNRSRSVHSPSIHHILIIIASLLQRNLRHVALPHIIISHTVEIAETMRREITIHIYRLCNTRHLEREMHRHVIRPQSRVARIILIYL